MVMLLPPPPFPLGRPQTRRLCVRWGPSPLPEKGGRDPQKFSSHVCCGQLARWIKMAFGM